MTGIENDWNDGERRHNDRYGVDFYLSVHDRKTNALLGHVIDISVGGMRLISQKLIPINKIFLLSLDISLESGKRGQTSLEARSIWSREDDNPDLYDSGFQFLNLSPEAARWIQDIISELQS